MLTVVSSRRQTNPSAREAKALRFGLDPSNNLSRQLCIERVGHWVKSRACSPTQPWWDPIDRLRNGSSWGGGRLTPWLFCKEDIIHSSANLFYLTSRPSKTYFEGQTKRRIWPLEGPNLPHQPHHVDGRGTMKLHLVCHHRRILPIFQNPIEASITCTYLRHCNCVCFVYNCSAQINQIWSFEFSLSRIFLEIQIS